jgi:hypothetical protein
MLTAAKLKCTLVLKADELLTIPAPDGKPRVALRIKLPDRVLSADIAAKYLRRAQAAIKDLGAENVAVILQGNLVGDAIADAGLSAMPKGARVQKAGD